MIGWWIIFIFKRSRYTSSTQEIEDGRWWACSPPPSSLLSLSLVLS